MEFPSILLGCLMLASLAMSARTAQQIRVPLKYNMVSEGSFVRPRATHLVSAYMACPGLNEAKVTVCAELPHNWNWNPDRGYVFLNIFNVNKTDDVSKAIATTGTPGAGTQKPTPCVDIAKWPGGNMYVRVDANNYAPVVYMISAKVTPASVPQIGYKVPARTDMTAPRNSPFEMRASAVLSKHVALVYDNNLQLEIDVCYDTSLRTPIMTTSIVAMSGTLTHYVCDNLPCNADSPNVKCNVASPMPVERCHVQFTQGLQKAYVHIHAAGGRLLSNQTYLSEFKFAASFSSK